MVGSTRQLLLSVAVTGRPLWHERITRSSALHIVESLLVDLARAPGGVALVVGKPLRKVVKCGRGEVEAPEIFIHLSQLVERPLSNLGSWILLDQAAMRHQCCGHRAESSVENPAVDPLLERCLPGKGTSSPGAAGMRIREIREESERAAIAVAALRSEDELR